MIHWAVMVVLVLLFAAPSNAQECDPDFIGPRTADDPCLVGDPFPPEPPISPEMCEAMRNDDGVVQGEFAMGITETDACWEAIDNLQGQCFNDRCAGCTDVMCRCTCLQPPMTSGNIMCVCNAWGRICPDIPEECRER